MQNFAHFTRLAIFGHLTGHMRRAAELVSRFLHIAAGQVKARHPARRHEIAVMSLLNVHL
jgi:hypothetical protein